MTPTPPGAPLMRRVLCLFSLLLLAALAAACRAAAVVPPPGVATPTAAPSTATPPSQPTAAPTATVAPTAAPTATPLYSGPLSPPCGVALPALPPAAPPTSAALSLDAAAEAELRAAVPPVAWPALQRLLDAPGTVGLVAYQMGRDAEGVRWNAGTPMPLASVAKLITLVAYVEAVAAGELNPTEPVTLAELDRFYLPNFDLGAHRRALAELRADGLMFSSGGEDAVALQDVPWMMIRHSSNAAADYLHLRLGQARIEATAAALGLDGATGQSAPCTFLGQFLMMANHSRGQANDTAVLSAYLDDPAGAADYGRDLALLADAYTEQATFRAAEEAWRERVRRPSIDTQRFFAENLAPQGTAGGYAALMARLAQNGLSNADSSFQARRYLEWPNQFDANVEWASNVGYKNGALPGVLATVYYAYRWGETAPVIVVLFYRDLPQDTYRRWRNDLPHDEFARWLLADPAAIPRLSRTLVTSDE